MCVVVYEAVPGMGTQEKEHCLSLGNLGAI